MTDQHRTNHYSEDTLELFLLAPGSLDPRLRREIGDHLAGCAACSALRADLTAMHEMIGAGASGEPTGEDRRAADRMARRGRDLVPVRGLRTFPGDALDGYAEVVEPTGMAIVRRIFGYVRAYPVRSAATVSFAAALAIVGVMTLSPKPDVNPVYAKFSNNLLHVFNQRGDTIWTRLTPGMPDQGSDQATDFENKRLLLVEDVDGDGENEVIVNGHRTGGAFSPESLYCFDGKAGLKWKAGCGPIVRLGENAHMQIAQWRILSFFAMSLPGERRPRLYYLAQAVPFMTSKVGELDPSDGSERQAYLHAGGVYLDVRCDLAGDSTPEIVLGAINNAFRTAAAIVLDPKDFSGYGTTTAEYRPQGMQKAKEVYYVAFGPTDVSLLRASHLYNTLAVIEAVDDTVVRFHTNETADAVAGGIIYTFGRSMHLLSAYPNDPFIRSRESMVNEMRLSGPIDSTYLGRLRDGVRFHVRDGNPVEGPL